MKPMQTVRRFEDRVAVVTGASRGIGRATALRLASEGADVVVNYLNSADAAADVVREVQAGGRRAVAVRADVSVRDQMAALVDATVAKFGRLDVVVSNAAAGGFHPAGGVKPATAEAVFRTNALPVLWLAQAAADPLASVGSDGGDRGRQGKVVAISSHGATRGVPNYATVGASKAAMESLVRHLALDLGPRGINFNVVSAGMVATEAVRTMPHAEKILEAAADRMMVPRRHITPEDVAGVVAMLCSPDADLIQGQTLTVDGGIAVGV